MSNLDNKMDQKSQKHIKDKDNMLVLNIIVNFPSPPPSTTATRSERNRRYQRGNKSKKKEGEDRSPS